MKPADGMVGDSKLGSPSMFLNPWVATLNCVAKPFCVGCQMLPMVSD